MTGPFLFSIHLASSFASRVYKPSSSTRPASCKVPGQPLNICSPVTTLTEVIVASHNSSSEEPEHLPYPATKLIIAQYWHCSRDPPFWGYLIVGTFYDPHNNIVWSTEIFAFQPDTRRDRGARSDASSESDVESTSSRELDDRFARSLNLAQSTSARNPAYAPAYPSHLNAQHFWDPTLAGPVPGHWVTEYDHRLGNWVNTWQPDLPYF
ncbi:uncharacterized protein ColSpa_10754 [Colletotrichum spaethianum]|uniref:Uncharacterized protein n=1 Tax=Colletotrichum spaethianum TaxID=700344 RepID=A0AA37PE17_9PEZI|nr:uncharacterized protein ColSpa_10754 [Colletotrichum spaethianum]GKT50573.1 hypothetical protein ColSpa_10754 [Colletotrichum spaethianum]